MPRRAIVYLLAGIICATGAVVIAQQYMEHSPGPKKPTIKMTEVAVVTGHVEYARPVVLNQSADNDSQVKWVNWPAEHVLDGFVTKSEGLGEGTFLAVRSLRPGHVLQVADVKRQEVFLPDKAYIDYFRVKEEMMETLSPGQRVDVFRKQEGGGLDPFIRHARVISLAEAPETLMQGEASGGKGAVGGQISIYVVLNESMREEIEQIRRKQEPVVKLSRYASSHELPEFIPVGPSLREKAARRQVKMLESMIGQNEYAAALGVLEELGREYSEFEFVQKALKRRGEIERKLASKIYEEAQETFEAEWYEQTVQLCDKIRERELASPALQKKVTKLSERAKQKKKKKIREKTYRQMCDTLFKALEGGNLPRTKKVMSAMKENYSDYEAGAGLQAPEEVISAAQKRYYDLKDDFKVDMNVIKYYVGKQNKEDALSKLREMEQRFPQHPRLIKIREKIREKGWLK